MARNLLTISMFLAAWHDVMMQTCWLWQNTTGRFVVIDDN
jgi:hypothetical protein